MILFNKVIWLQLVLILDLSKIINLSRSITVNGDIVKLQIWDTAGQ
jgi:GTPase SAR1 family protein